MPDMTDTKKLTVALVGGHGQIALQMTKLASLCEAETRNIIRNPDHADDVRDHGGIPVVADIETCSVAELAEAYGDADVVVFAAGVGPGSGKFRKYTVDLAGSIKAQQAAIDRGITHFVQISFLGAGYITPAGTDEVFTAYWDAKREADNALRNSGLEWTIIKPARLTDGTPTGMVHTSINDEPDAGKSISRADVAGFTMNMILAGELSTGEIDLFTDEN